jgi:hypothetical protein
MEVAAEHAERQGLTTGQHVIKGFFFNGIDLKTGCISGGYAEYAFHVESHAAYPALAGRYPTAVGAGQAADDAVALVPDQFRGRGHGVIGHQVIQRFGLMVVIKHVFPRFTHFIIVCRVRILDAAPCPPIQ